MGFNYSCFISYSHGQYNLMQNFINDLKESLSSSLEPYFREPVYIDQDRLQPGFRYNLALARAICASVAMIIVYTPRYAEQDYCLREFIAMKRIEGRRRRVVGATEYGPIIPIIFRGRQSDLPDDLARHIHYTDFSRYTTADTSILTNPEYVTKIEDIARYIWELQNFYRPHVDRLCINCERFPMPRADHRYAWAPRTPVFPGRVA